MNEVYIFTAFATLAFLWCMMRISVMYYISWAKADAADKFALIYPGMYILYCIGYWVLI
jgi:hypothetical protein